MGLLPVVLFILVLGLFVAAFVYYFYYKSIYVSSANE